jgi:hypothetical protein
MRAEAIRTLAEDAQDSKVRAMMLRIAADYDRLAKNADDRAAQDSIMFRVVSPERILETSAPVIEAALITGMSCSKGRLL